MTSIIYQVDAFTDRPFTGNPAGVCLLSAPAKDAWMQRVASEMNVSETAFLVREAEGFRLRWMTPTVEVDLCGHATLASAHILWETGVLAAGEEASFYTRSGLLTATRLGDAIVLDFPARPPQPVTQPAGLAEALGLTPLYVGRSAEDYLVEVATVDDVRKAKPDQGRLSQLPMQGVILTSQTDGGPYDFVSRYFAPAIGLAEDPVTGSAHTCLGPYWAGKLNRRDLLGYQASARGGVVGVRVEGDRVHLSGQAVTVLRCELIA